MTEHLAFPADGYRTSWTTVDGSYTDELTLTWENEAWTATGRVERENVEYVIRLSPLWQVRQFLLFRDLPEPDLWLGTDGHGRWGEVNGAHRTDLDGALDVSLACTAFTHALPIRRLPLAVGDAAELSVLAIDVETLGVVPVTDVYERIGTRRWRVTRSSDTTPSDTTPSDITPSDTTPSDITEFDVDDYGLPLDLPAAHVRRN